MEYFELLVEKVRSMDASLAIVLVCAVFTFQALLLVAVVMTAMKREKYARVMLNSLNAICSKALRDAETLGEAVILLGDHMSDCKCGCMDAAGIAKAALAKVALPPSQAELVTK